MAEIILLSNPSSLCMFASVYYGVAPVLERCVTHGLTPYALAGMLAGCESCL